MKSAKASRFFEWIMNLTLLNFLWILFSLPVITVFASSAALCRVIQNHRTSLDREGIMSLYWKSFVKQLVPATCHGLMMLVLLSIVVSNFLFAERFADHSLLHASLLAWSLFLGAVHASVLLFIFPLAAAQEHGWRTAAKIAFVRGIQKLPHSLAMMAKLAGLILLYYFVPILIPLFGFSLLAFLIIAFTDKAMGADGRPPATAEVVGS